MKQKMKSILAALLSVMMVFYVVPMSVWAEEAESSSEPVYTQIKLQNDWFYSYSYQHPEIKRVRDAEGNYYFTNVEVGSRFDFFVEYYSKQVIGEPEVYYNHQRLEPVNSDIRNNRCCYYYTIDEVVADGELTGTNLGYRVSTEYGTIFNEEYGPFAGSGEETLFFTPYSHYRPQSDQFSITATNGEVISVYADSYGGFEITLSGVSAETQLIIHGYDEIDTYKVNVPMDDRYNLNLVNTGTDNNGNQIHHGAYLMEQQGGMKCYTIAADLPVYCDLYFLDSYGKGDNFAVKANGTVIRSADQGSYLLKGQPGEEIFITVEDVVEKNFTALRFPMHRQIIYGSNQEGWDGWVEYEDRAFTRVEVGKSFDFYVRANPSYIDGELKQYYNGELLEPTRIEADDAQEWIYYYHIDCIEEDSQLTLTGLKYQIFSYQYGRVYSSSDRDMGGIAGISETTIYYEPYSHYRLKGEKYGITLTNGTVNHVEPNGYGYDVTVSNVTDHAVLNISDFDEMETYQVYVPEEHEAVSSTYRVSPIRLYEAGYIHDGTVLAYYTVAEDAAFRFEIVFTDGYGKGEGFAVKVADKILTSEIVDGKEIYSVNGSAGDSVEVTVEGVEHIHNYNHWDKLDANTHKGTCACGNVITESHTFSGNTCTKCGYTYSIYIPITPPVTPTVTPEVVTHFATTIGNFKDVAYFGREAREGDVVTLKVSNTDEGDRLGLDYHNIRVEYQTEGCTMIRSGIDYHGDPLYKDGMAAEFKLAKGLNKVTATVYYNDTFAGTFQLFYCYIN